MGRRINNEIRSTMSVQASILNSQTTLRLGTNREFAVRVIAPDFMVLQSLFPKTILTINSYQQGTESALLSGQIDIGIDCERPNDPEISYKLLVDESLIAVASKKFIQEYKKEYTHGNYFALPHLLCERLNPDRFLLKMETQVNVLAKFNDIATTRGVCLQGVGWALLPPHTQWLKRSKWENWFNWISNLLVNQNMASGGSEDVLI